MPKDQNNTVQEIVEEKIWKDIDDELKYVATYASPERREELLNFLRKQFLKMHQKAYTAGMEAERERILERLPEKNPNESRLRQNRNGIDYCGTCEQGWEDCSCPARNTGYNTALSEIRTIIEQV